MAIPSISKYIGAILLSIYHPRFTSPLKEPFKGNLGFPRKFRSLTGQVWSRIRSYNRTAPIVPSVKGALEPGGSSHRNFLGNPRFPLKGSFQGDINLGVVYTQKNGPKYSKTKSMAIIGSIILGSFLSHTARVPLKGGLGGYKAG